jgi:hypothetical protein
MEVLKVWSRAPLSCSPWRWEWQGRARAALRLPRSRAPYCWGVSLQVEVVEAGPLPLSANHGGRGWWRWLLPLSIGAAVLLLLSLLPAGRGGEEQGVRNGGVVASGISRPSPSNGGRAVEMSGKVAPAWCCGLPSSYIETPPPNKLLAGQILDFGLESPATPSPSLP